MVPGLLSSRNAGSSRGSPSAPPLGCARRSPHYEGSASEPRAPGVGGAESSVQPFSFIILIRNSPRGDVICPASGNFLQPETSRKTCTSRSWPPLSGYLRAPARLSNREGEVAAGGPRRRRGSDVVAAEQGNTGCNLLPPPPPPPM